MVDDIQSLIERILATAAPGARLIAFEEARGAAAIGFDSPQAIVNCVVAADGANVPFVVGSLFDRDLHKSDVRNVFLKLSPKGGLRTEELWNMLLELLSMAPVDRAEDVALLRRSIEALRS